MTVYDEKESVDSFAVIAVSTHSVFLCLMTYCYSGTRYIFTQHIQVQNDHMWKKSKTTSKTNKKKTKNKKKQNTLSIGSILRSVNYLEIGFWLFKVFGLSLQNLVSVF